METTLLPDPNLLHLERLAPTDKLLTLELTSMSNGDKEHWATSDLTM